MRSIYLTLARVGPLKIFVVIVTLSFSVAFWAEWTTQSARNSWQEPADKQQAAIERAVIHLRQTGQL